jgi:hypothetical protein
VTRRRGINRQLTWAICSAVAAAVVLAGLVALGLIRHSYDGQARSTLHREAALVAELASRPATVSATRPGKPAAQLLVGTGVQLVRVRATGRIAFGSFALDAADVGAAQGGRTVSATRTIGGSRYLVEIAPVTGDGGVVLAQKASVAGSRSAWSLRRCSARGWPVASRGRWSTRPQRPTGSRPETVTSGCNRAGLPRWPTSPTA